MQSRMKALDKAVKFQMRVQFDEAEGLATN